MDTKTLESRISDLTQALGDPTRRAIYIAVRESPEPLTTSKVAALFDIHPNVARHHLDRLAHDGYLQVSHRRPAGGPGAGRPAKCYESTSKEVTVHFAPRRFEMLTEMLFKVLEELEPENVAEVAEKVGRGVRRTTRRRNRRTRRSRIRRSRSSRRQRHDRARLLSRPRRIWSASPHLTLPFRRNGHQSSGGDLLAGPRDCGRDVRSTLLPLRSGGDSSHRPGRRVCHPGAGDHRPLSVCNR